MEILRPLVLVYIVPSMRYKIGLQQLFKDLLPFYAILRSIPNKLLVVVAMFG